jgi:hypothetical protein
MGNSAERTSKARKRRNFIKAETSVHRTPHIRDTTRELGFEKEKRGLERSRDEP